METITISRVQHYAKRQLMFKPDCLHAVYGISYKNQQNKKVTKIAGSPSEIKYFTNDLDFVDYLKELELKYSPDLIVYSVHK